MSRFCEECGEPVRGNENFCSNCGAKIIRDESPSPSTVKSTSTSGSTSTDAQSSDTAKRVAEFYAKKKAAVQSPSPSTVQETSTSESTSTDAQSSDTAKRVAEFYAKKNAAVQSPSPSTVKPTSTTSSSKDDDKPTDRLLVKIIGGFLVFTILLAMAASSSKITSHSSNEPTQTEETSVKSQSAPVPDVVGKTQSDAVAALKAAGLEVKISDSYSDSVPTGKIISQSPNSGAKLEKGQTVYIYVSKGVDPAKSPAPLTEADLAIGGLTLGMSRQVVEQKFGASFLIHYNIIYGNNDAVQLVRCTGGEAKTPRGIHIGSTIADVENAYGKNYSTESASDKTLHSYHLENADLNFLINAAGRVDTIAFYIIYADAPSAETPKPSPPPAPKPASDG